MARLGGDEFGVIMLGIEQSFQSVIRRKVDRINEALRNESSNAPEVSLSVSMAFSKADFPEDLYSRADQALYLVKEGGRVLPERMTTEQTGPA